MDIMLDLGLLGIPLPEGYGSIGSKFICLGVVVWHNNTLYSM